MRLPVPPWTVVRFGLFEVHRTSGQLRKHGIRVKLQDQPFCILTLLLEQPGEIVTREQLRNRLWAEGTYVDFEHSLNAAIAKLRQALGDSAENPRFIETLARRGYRFICSVEIIEPLSGEGKPDTIPSAAAQVAPTLVRSRVLWLAVAAVSLLAAVGGTLAMLSTRTTRGVQTLLTRLTSDPGLTTEPALSRDGKLVAYASDRREDGNLDLWVQQVGTRQPIRLTSLAGDEREPDFSPDGSKIVFRADTEGGGIYVIPSLGGEPQFLAPHGQSPRFSPDGNWIAYWVGMMSGSALEGIGLGSVSLVPVSGGPAHLLVTDLSEIGRPVWSPDGKNLLVEGIRRPSDQFEGNADWWLVPVGGGPAVQTGASTALRRRGLAFSFLTGGFPRVRAWQGDYLVFSAKVRDSLNLWQIRINSTTGSLIGEPEALTSGSSFAVYPSIADDGRIAFASLTQSVNIWSLPIDANHGKPAGELRRVTQGISYDGRPVFSPDAKLLVFVSDRLGTNDIWIRNLETTNETPLVATSAAETFPTISHSGTRVAYSTFQSSYVLTTGGQSRQKVCDECGWPWAWSQDDRQLLMADPGQDSKEGSLRRIYALDLNSNRRTVFLSSDKYSLFQTRYSPDGLWLAFVAIVPRTNQAVLFVAPIREGRPAGPESWILISDAKGWADKPRWSPDGNYIYFLSERDGFRCLWAQRIRPTTKQPVGQPNSIVHLHNSRRSMMHAGLAQVEFSVAKDKLAFNMTELTGNIWLAETRKTNRDAFW